MTNPLSVPENTSLVLSVRSSADPQVLKNDPPPLSTPATAVTSSRSVPPERAKASPGALVRGGSAIYEDEGAQLSERESIFATHYVASDGPVDSPLLPPTEEGRRDDLTIQQDAAATMALPVPQFPYPSDSPPTFHKTTSSPTIASYRGIEDGLDGRSSRRRGLNSTQSRALGFLDYYKTRGCSLDRIGRGERAQVLPPFISPVDSPVNRPSTPCENFGSPPMPGNRKHIAAEQHLYKHELVESREQAVSAGAERSLNRHETGRVDKAIEATLANTELAQSARSRKTSHYLGLFKENTPSQEHRRRDDKGKERTSQAKAPGSGDLAKLNQEPQQISFRDDAHPSSLDHGGLNRNAFDGLPSGAIQSATEKQITPRYENEQQLGALLDPPAESRELSSSIQISNSFMEMTDEPFPTQTISDNGTVSGSAQQMAHAFPLRLLEEIRNHHNLTPGAERGTSFSRSIPTISAETTWAATNGHHPHPASALGTEKKEAHNGETPDRDSGENEDEDESDKEQISSALYFPHQAPTLETTVISDDDLAGHDEGGQRARGFSRSKGDIEIGVTDQIVSSLEPDAKLLEICQSQDQVSLLDEVDIDIRSSNEHSYLYSDLQQPPPALDNAEFQPNGRASEDGASSASNSDYDSVDETTLSSREDDPSLTDDADTTPTATPVAHTPLTRFKSRSAHQHPPAPLGAVELKPYNHQVGGHTTVFRFSRRAVCKQLSNRENEFYETIERRHPELLKFLPRYAWSSALPIRLPS